MLRKIVSAAILIPLVLILVGFAVANRQTVTLSFDPFDQAQPAYALTLPLFAVAFILLILGVLIGGIAAWLKQGQWRRAARSLDREVRELRSENDLLRRQNAGELTPAGGAPASSAPQIMPPTVL